MGRRGGTPAVALLSRSRREWPVDMAHAAIAPLIGVKFDKFLYAPLREDRNGTPLTVLSALARSDVDPWQEAFSLARMPSDAAVLRLTGLIAALQGESTQNMSASSIADLVALLPKAPVFAADASDSVFAAAGPQRAQIRFALGALAILALIALALSNSLSPTPGINAKSSPVPTAAAVATAPRMHDP
ncbi:MAG: hypothetical protein E7774_11315 [Bradyrhizobium sp.]|nr:MAG: hypothetical protein E7774_11315 [Bradyrhizobium sp.]